MMFVMGFFEAVGAASIFPFIYIVSTPKMITANNYLSFAYNYIGFSSTDNFIIFIGVGVFLLIVIGYTFRAFTNYWALKFVHMSMYSINKQLLRTYLSHPYSWFLNRHTSSMEKVLLVETYKFATLVLLPLIHVISNITVSIFFVVLLVFINPVIAVCAVLLIGSTYLLIYKGFNKKRAAEGIERTIAQGESFKLVKETLAGIKEIKIFGLEENQLLHFEKPARKLSEKQANIQIISELPQFIFQAIAFGGIVALLILLKVIHHQEITSILPLLGLYAFAGFRLIPAFQRIYSNLTLLNSAETIVKEIHTDLITNNEKTVATEKATSPEEYLEKMEMKEQIELKHVSFNYPLSKTPIVQSVDLIIKANRRIGFTGATGSGKTTLIDIVLGLLQPTGGTILIDGERLTTENVKAWQNTIGYVPQHVFLMDDTIAVNIAFGLPFKKIDNERVKKAAQLAQLDTFINTLEHGYESMIGERGVRLSGGQRQRLGIARALYRSPSILIFDEATNALDKETEELILEAIFNLKETKTILIISHHKNVLKYCHEILTFENGKIKTELNLKMND
jgi:ABC-type multidrug transport system fused ATPase/permease subunit